MRGMIERLLPDKGISHIFYVLLNLLLPALVYILVRTDLVLAAVIVMLMSKWRMFAVRPRFWWPNIRTNAVDILVGLSAIAFMYIYISDLPWFSLGIALLWAVWLLFIKPKTSVFWVSAQAFIAMVSSLIMVTMTYSAAPLWALVVIFGAVCFFTSHHFFYSFDEQYLRLLSYTWAYFGAALMWVLGHWLIFYGVVSQPALILITLGLGLGSLYYLDHFEKLSNMIRRQIIFILAMTLVVIIVFSDWGDKLV